MVDGDLGGGGGDVGLADTAGDVDAVEQDAIAFELRLQRNAGIAGKFKQRRLFVEGQVVLDGLERKRTIHGSGLKVEEAEAASEMRGKRAFARASGTVNGDDGSLAFALFRLRRRLGWRHSADSPFSGLNLRAGGRLPKGFLLPLNLSKVLPGLSDLSPADLPKGFFPAKPPPLDFPA